MLRNLLMCSCVVSLAACSNGAPPNDKSGSDRTVDLPEGSSGYAELYVPGLGMQRVPYVVENGEAVAGDIILSKAQLEEPVVSVGEVLPQEAAGAPEMFSVGRALSTYRWPGGVIPFDIDRTTIPVGSTLDQGIQQAMASWAALTPITFVPYGGSGDYVHYQATLPAGTGGLSSSVGRIQGSGQHVVQLATDAGCCPGIPLHETGHMIGLYHEMQRADRDSYVKVYDGLSPVGCTPGSTCLPNHFAGCNGGIGNYFRYADEAQGNIGNDGEDILPFDFSSIMIYAGDTTGCCGLPCMTDLSGNAFPSNNTLSATDGAGVSQMYYLIAWGNWIGTSNEILML